MKIFLIFFLSIMILNVIESHSEECVSSICEINPDEINPDEINPDEINPDEINPEITHMELGNALTGYLTVISILIASTGFVLAMAPNIGKELRSQFRVLSFLLSFSAGIIVLLGIYLILSTQTYFHNLVAFVALSIPIGMFMFLIATRK